MQKYLDQKDDLNAGRIPRVQREGFTVRGLCNRFFTSKEHLRKTGEITNKTFVDYHRICRVLVSIVGISRLVDDLAADDFQRLRKELSKTRGPVTLGNEIQRI